MAILFRSNSLTPAVHMATQADVRRIALALPGTAEADNDFAFGVLHKGKSKGLVWSWKERVVPKIGVRQLREVLTEGWRCQAPAALVKEFDGGAR